MKRLFRFLLFAGISTDTIIPAIPRKASPKSSTPAADS